MKIKNYYWGLACIITYVIILAIQPLAFNSFDVRFHMDTFLLILTVFTPTFLFFNLIHGRGHGKLRQKVRENGKNVLLLNVFTCMAWVPIILSWKYIDEAIANTISLGLGPVLLVIRSAVLKNKQLSLKDRLVAIGIGLVIVWLTYISIDGTPAEEGKNPWIGILLALASGVGVTGYLLVSKGMNRNDWAAKDLMAVRFPMILVVCVLFIVFSAEGLSFSVEASHSLYIAAFLLVLTIFMALPVYLVQVSIKMLRPMTVSVLIILSPLVTLILKMVDGQYEGFPTKILLGIILGIGLMIIHQLPAKLFQFGKKIPADIQLED